MKATFIIISAAVFYFHVARGLPADANKADKAAPAVQASNPLPSPVAEKPETCKANIEGREQTLNTGDRYCLNDKTNRVCNYGDWIDYECPEDSKCLKHKTEWKVLCRIVRKNPPQPDHPQDSDVQKPQDSNPAPPAKQEPPPPPPAPAAEPAPPPPAPHAEPPPTPAVDQPKPEPHAATTPAPAPEQPKPTPAEPKPEPTATSPPKPETCKATVDGKEQTLQPGDRYCLDDNTNRVCNHGGELIDFTCPTGSKCMKSPEKWEVLCRVINKNDKSDGQH